MDCGDKKNPLQHGGTSQPERSIAAHRAGYSTAPAGPGPLDPDYIQADERGYAEWISFAARFSQYLAFYDGSNTVAGNWQPFFSNDISAIIGTIAIQDIDAYRLQIKGYFNILQNDDYKGKTALLKTALGRLFGAALSLATSLDRVNMRIPAAHPLRLLIEQSVATKLAPSLSRLMGYYKGGLAENLITESAQPAGWSMMDFPVQSASDLLATMQLSPVWTGNVTGLSAWYAALPEDDSIYGTGSSPFERIRHAGNHNLLAGAFDTLLSTYARIVSEAGKSLVESLSSTNGHQPHYALFLTFLHLYRHAQDALNTVTGRHLEFYYRDVLRLQERGANPDSAHLILTLAKGQKNLIVPAGTAFNGGKDGIGKDLTYTLDSTTTVGTAVVAQLKSLYFGEADDNIGTSINNGRAFASPVSNSADGLGAALPATANGWHPFASRSFINGVVSAVKMPKADIGFAISSPNLLLGEGSRSIKVLAYLAQAVPDTLPQSGVAANVFLTTEKGWLQKSVTISCTNTGLDQDPAHLYFTLKLDPTEAAITRYNKVLHGGSYTNSWPVMRVVLAQDDTVQYAYQMMSGISMNVLTLTVGAGVDEQGFVLPEGLKNLKLINDYGPVDGSKTFEPFGRNPRRNAALIIGSEEVAVKRGVQAQMRLSWLDLPDGGKPVRFAVPPSNPSTVAIRLGLDILAGGFWSNIINTGEVSQVGSTALQKLSKFPDSLTALNPGNNWTDKKGIAPFDEPFAPYSIRSRAGFLRITLQDDFLYEEYIAYKSKYLVSHKPEERAPGDTPYSPKLASLTLHYTVEARGYFNSLDSDQRDEEELKFYHVHPFGEVAQMSYPAAQLLPRFYHTDAQTGTIADAAEWCIGISGLDAGERVNLLVQVLEGTANPLTVKPEKHVVWSYLSGNDWKEFDSQSVIDDTAQLIRPGIIAFILPDDATTAHNVLPAGLIWLRASVAEKADAVCKIAAVMAGAAHVTFADNGNAPDHATLPLPAGSIKKLSKPLSALKTVSQPYATFSGRAAEDSAHYYLRASERLRHKDRAITIWDYERLLLEAFPELHRVKCLNHTRYEGGTTYNETLPGHVTIITIPKIDALSSERNPLRPYTSERTLSAIADFLKKRVSPHVQLHVRHPLFEEVSLAFSMKLMPGFEWGIWSEKLKEEITAFLTPWAYGGTQDVTFGGRVEKSVLINFIEDRPYVDYISLVRVYHQVEGEPADLTDLDTVVATTSRSILVSAPASAHAITEIPIITVADASPNCNDLYLVD